MPASLISTSVILAFITVQCCGRVPPIPKDTSSDAISISATEESEIDSPNEAETSFADEKIAGEEKAIENLPECATQKCNCSDFTTQSAAQLVFDAFPDDRHKLDKDRDGIACESLPQ